MIAISGRGIEDGSLDRRAQRDGRRGAAVATPEQAQVHGADTLVDVEQLDVATVAGEKRPHTVERAGDPDVDVVGMQTVGDEQAGQQLVGGDPGDELGCVLIGEVHDARQTRRRTAR